MGVPWGIECGNTKYESRQYYINKWEAFCAAGLCRHFVFPIDDVLYEFKQSEDGQVIVTTIEDINVIVGMMKLSCGDGTYEMFDRITDGIDLYLPDGRGFRRIDRPEFEWNYQRADSLDELCSDFYENSGLPDEIKRLSRELRVAAEFCKTHRMMLGISY